MDPWPGRHLARSAKRSTGCCPAESCGGRRDSFPAMVNTYKLPCKVSFEGRKLLRVSVSGFEFMGGVRLGFA